MKINDDAPLRTWDEARAELFAPEEIAECDLEVAALGEMLKAERAKDAPSRPAIARPLAPGVRQELLDAIVHTYFKANKASFKEGDPMFEWLEPVYKPKMDRIAAESIAQGREQGRVDIARRMIADGVAPEVVVKYTGISPDRIDRSPEHINAR